MMPIALPLTPQRIEEQLNAFATLRENIAQKRRSLARSILVNSIVNNLADVLGSGLEDYFYILGRPERVVLTDDEISFHGGVLQTMAQAKQEEDRLAYSLSFMISLLYLPLAQHPFLRLDLLMPWVRAPLSAAVTVNASYILDAAADGQKLCDFYADLFAQLSDESSDNFLIQGVRKAALSHFRMVELSGSVANLVAVRGHYGRMARQYLLAHNAALDWDFPQAGKGEVIHLAVLSSHLHSHGHGFPAFVSMIAGLDRTRFKTTLICLPDMVDTTWYAAQRDAIAQVFDEVCEITWPSGEAIQKIRDLNLDILFSVDPVDVPLIGQAAEIVHYRLARRQGTAYFNNATTGIPTMDYIISSPQLDSPAFSKTHFIEHVELIETLPFCYNFESYFSGEAENITRADLGLPEDCKILTCGNSVLVKFRLEALQAYLQIMKNVENLYCVLMPGGELYHQENLFWYRFTTLVTAAGVSLQRFVIVPHSTRRRQHGLVALADVYFDFFPFSGANSLLDPLYYGTPAAVLSEECQLRCRQGAAILEMLACDELVAHSVPAFIELGTRLLVDQEFHLSVRLKLGAETLKKSQIFDSKMMGDTFSKVFQTIHAERR
jgi:predicted O-linked N-acetylglucosamine transferase (SPINDLY family)